MLSKDELKEIPDIVTEEVLVPEWKGTTWKVRGLAVAESDAFEQSLVEAKRRGATLNMTNMRARLVVRCVLNDAGGLYFDEADAEWLGKKSAKAVRRLYDVAARLSGMSQSEMEEMEKNLQSIPPEASS